MTEPLSDRYWLEEFQVTEADLDRLAAYIRKAGEAQDLATLAQRVVRGRLRYGHDSSTGVATSMTAAASVRLWDPAADWIVGDRALIAVRDIDLGRHVPAVGDVIEVLPSTVRFLTRKGWTQTPVYKRAQSGSEVADKWASFVSQLIAEGRGGTDIDHQAEAIILEYDVADRISNALHSDERFVQLGGHWFLRELTVPPSEQQLTALAWTMCGLEGPQSINALVQMVRPPLVEGDTGLFGLYLAMRFRSEIFLFEGADERARANLKISKFLVQAAESLARQMLSELAEADRPVSYQELQRTVVRPSLGEALVPETLDTYLVSQLEQNDQLIEVSKGVWLDRAAIEIVLDRAYELLQNSTEMSARELLSQSLGISLGSHECSPAFVIDFESALHQDIRFIFDFQQDLWSAIPLGNHKNDLAYVILYQEHRPLSRQQIVDQAKNVSYSQSLDFELESDTRFKQMPDDRWMLEHWILINDLATSYLAQSPIPLLAETVKEKVCQAHNIPLSNAIFEPKGDSQFIRAPLGKWTCPSPDKVITAEMLEQLVRSAGRATDGITLEVLVRQSLNNDPSAFNNLEQALEDDGRLVHCNGLWYPRDKCFYSVTSDDLDRIEAYILQTGYPIPADTLAQACLDRLVYLTDLREKLADASQFIELGSAGWIVGELQPYAGGRGREINYPIRSGKYLPTIDPAEFESIEQEDQVDHSRDLPAKPCDKRKTESRVRSITIALSFEDIRDGTLVATSRLGSLLDCGSDLLALRFVDDAGIGFSCWYDADNKLFHGFGDWFESRGLTFGDRIRLSATNRRDEFSIQAVSERSEQVYLEGVRRSHVQSLIDEAKRVNRSYHDLTLEVFEHFGIPLHIDDLWGMVNYRRTARRGTLSTILSSHSYFVSEGAGYWRFDKKEYARMIRDLERKIKRLERENQKLRDRDAGLVREAPEIEGLRRELRELRAQWEASRGLSSQYRRKIEKLKSEIETAKKRVAEAEALAEQITQEYRQVQDSLADAKQEIDTLNARLKKQADAIATVEEEKRQLLTRITQLTTEFQAMSEIEAHLHENIAQLDDGLQQAIKEAAELRHQNQSLNENNKRLRKENEVFTRQVQEITALEEQNQILSVEVALLRDRGEALNKRKSQLHDRIADLEKTLQEATTEINAAKEQNQSLERDLAQLEAEKQRAEEQLTRVTGKLEALRVEHGKALAILDSWSGKLAKWWAARRSKDIPSWPDNA